MRATVIVFASLLLAGCQSTVVRKAETEQAACRARPFRTAVERARCLNEAAEQTVRFAGNNEDLLRVQMARKIVLAEKIDAKQITQAEADLLMAEGMSNAISTERSRLDAEESLRNQRSAVRAMNRPLTIAPASSSIVPAMDFSR